MDTISTVILYISLLLWVGWGAFAFYTTIRDDIRRERERKEEKKKQ